MSTSLQPEGLVGYLAGQAQKLTGQVAGSAAAHVGLVNNATVNASTLSAAMLAPATVINRTGSTGGFTDTFDTAANIIAAFPQYDIGDTWELLLVNIAAQTLTYAAGVGNTLTGVATNAGSGDHNHIYITKLSATTCSILVC